MPRRYRPAKRKVQPDIKYGSEHLEMCINRLMVRGKKSRARAIMYDALDIIEQRTNRAPLETFDQALTNATPLVEVKPRRVGGATYQIPVEVAPDRRVSLLIPGYNPITVGLYKSMPDLGLPDGLVESSKSHLEDL